MTSTHFVSLEKRCQKLKKARIMRIVFFISILFLSAFGVFYFYHQSHKPEHILVVEKPIVAPPAMVSPKPVERVEIPAIEDNVTIEAVQKKEDVLFLGVHGLTPKIAKLSEEESQEAMRSLKQEHELLNQFKALQNYENAFALAQFYFNLKSYQETIAWAKKASQLDTHSDKPRILYAKAKFYLGQRSEAISSLELFLSYIKSEEAQELLNFYKGQE